jgi:hypothetical protein
MLRLGRELRSSPRNKTEPIPGAANDPKRRFTYDPDPAYHDPKREVILGQ